METVISNPKPFILIGSDHGAQRVGIDENMNLDIKGKAVPLDILWKLGDFTKGSIIEILVSGGLSFFQYTDDEGEVYFYFSQQRGQTLNDTNKIKTRGVQLSQDKMIAYKRILKLAGYEYIR